MTQTPTQSGEITPLFGLEKQQLRPVAETIAGAPVVSFDVHFQHNVGGHYGYGGQKAIHTIAYTTSDGGEGERAVFVKRKRFDSRERRESRHYKALAEHGVPVPRLYGVQTLSDQTDVMFIEYLDPIKECDPFDRFFRDPHSLLPYLRLAAHINATQPSTEYAATLARNELHLRVSKQTPALEEIWTQACKGELGDPISQLCEKANSKLPYVQRLMEQLVDPLSKMEYGLCHNDYGPDSCGWRSEPREMLTVDLETVGFAPRFFDVANVLGPPDNVYERCAPRCELAQCYLEEYTRHSECRLSVNQVLEEARIVWMASELSFLWWWRNRAIDGLGDWTSDREEARRLFRHTLYKKIEAILQEV